MSRLALLLALALTAFAAPAAHANLLTNASFERPSFAGWAPYAGNQMDVGTLTTPGVAREGAGVGVAQTAQTGNSFHQDVTTTVLARRSYSLSVWVKSASGAPVKATLALFGILHTETEGTGTSFTAGAEWTLVTATLNTQREHSALRAQVYMHTTDQRLLVDGAQLHDVGLDNSSFELGSFAGWTGDVERSAAQLAEGARDGGWAGVVATAVGGRSFYQDHSVGIGPGSSYTFSLWVRSVSGQPVSGTAVLWGLGDTPEESASTTFTAGAGWSLVTATLSPTRGHSLLRSQVFLGTPGLQMYVDGAQLRTNELANAGFEQGFFRSWDRFPRGALTASTEVTAGVAHDGVGYGATRTEVPGRAFAQEVPVALKAGESRTFSAWLRSPTGARGSVVLTGTGGESGATPFYVGPRWTLVSAPLDSTSAHSGLRAEVVLDTPGVELDVDGASLSAGNARDDAQLLGPYVAPPPPAPDGDGDGVPDSADLCPTMKGGAIRRGCPLGLTNDTSISYARTRRGIRVVRYYVEATKGARVVVTCSRGCRKTVTKGKGNKRIQIKRLRGRALRNGARITVKVTMPGRLSATVVDRVAKRRRVAGRRTCVVPGTTKPKITC